MTGFAIYVGAALLFSLGAVFALGAAMEIEGRWRRLMVPTLYLLIPLNNCIGALISGRNLHPRDLLTALEPPTILVHRFFILAVLGICVARMLAAAFSRENRGAGGAALLVAFGLYFFANTVLSSALGTHPEFRHDQYYVPFLFAAIYATRTQDPETAIRFAKTGLFIFLVASCVTAVVAPQLAVETGYRSWIPGVTIRFWGLETHANTMGPLALVYLLLAMHQPFGRPWLQRLGMAMGVAVLLLAQSKTAWAAAVITIPLLLVLRSRAWGTVAFSLLALAVLAAAAVLLLPNLGISAQGILATEQAHEAATLTGRDDIWTVALQEWIRNPLFGYGNTMWNEAYRMQIGLGGHASSAHNQFLQTLSMAGSIGLIGLLIYLGILLRYAISARRASHGLSVALFTVVLVRCLTETPLGIDSFLSSPFLTQLLLFHIALAYGCRVVRAARPATSIISTQRAS